MKTLIASILIAASLSILLNIISVIGRNMRR